MANTFQVYVKYWYGGTAIFQNQNQGKKREGNPVEVKMTNNGVEAIFTLYFEEIPEDKDPNMQTS